MKFPQTLKHLLGDLIAESKTGLGKALGKTPWGLPCGVAYIIGTSGMRPENGHWLGSWNAQGQSRTRNLQAGHFAISHLKVSEERVASLRGIYTFLFKSRR